MNYAVLVQELPIYSERWQDCQKQPYGVRMRIRTRMRNMTNLTYMVIAFNMIQSKVRISDFTTNPLAIIISFIAFLVVCAAGLVVPSLSTMVTGNAL
jgi:hypothetical protein